MLKVREGKDVRFSSGTFLPPSPSHVDLAILIEDFHKGVNELKKSRNLHQMYL